MLIIVNMVQSSLVSTTASESKSGPLVDELRPALAHVADLRDVSAPVAATPPPAASADDHSPVALTELDAFFLVQGVCAVAESPLGH